MVIGWPLGLVWYGLYKPNQTGRICFASGSVLGQKHIFGKWWFIPFSIIVVLFVFVLSLTWSTLMYHMDMDIGEILVNATWNFILLQVIFPLLKYFWFFLFLFLVSIKMSSTDIHVPMDHGSSTGPWKWGLLSYRLCSHGSGHSFVVVPKWQVWYQTIVLSLCYSLQI